MSDKIDPNKAIVIPPEQHQLRQERPRQQPKQGEKGSTWEPHNGDTALDEWSLVIRTLRKAGKLPE